MRLRWDCDWELGRSSVSPGSLAEASTTERVPGGKCAVLCDLLGGQNGPKNSWTKILAEILASLLLGIDLISRTKIIFNQVV